MTSCRRSRYRRPGLSIRRSCLPAKIATFSRSGLAAANICRARRAAIRKPAYLGVEPFINGVAKALTQMKEAGLSNVRLFEGDAREVMERMPDQCLDRIFLLFPDPWPKARHAKRRFVQDETAAEFVRLLKPGGALRVATDVKAYADHALWILHRHPRLEWQARSAADWRAPPEDHLTTRYEMKKLGDCAPVFFDFGSSGCDRMPCANRHLGVYPCQHVRLTLDNVCRRLRTGAAVFVGEKEVRACAHGLHRMMRSTRWPPRWPRRWTWRLCASA